METLEKVILTNMCLIYDNNGHILIQDRKKSSWPGITLPGGHVEKDEPFVESTIREIKEETGLDIVNPILCGICQWNPLNGGRYIVFLYKCNTFSGQLKSSKEGEVFWIEEKDLLNYKLSADFIEMYQVIKNNSLSEFFVLKDDNNNDIQRKFL